MEVLVETSDFIIATNASGEIFVESKSNGVKVRISDYRDSILITSHSNIITPTSTNGFDAFRIRLGANNEKV